MSYIDQNLMPDEKIVFRTKKHVIIFMVPVIFILFACILSSNVGFVGNMNITFDQLTQHLPFVNHIHRMPAAIMLLLAIYTGLQQWLTYVTSDYVVTNRRVVMKEGFFDRYSCDTRLSTVSHVTVDQNLLAQAWNYGTVTINGFGGNQDRFIQLAKPLEFQKAVQSQLDTKS
ncbi:MAG: PH domain-containing protein [Pseudomonadota bacterium]